MSFFFIFIFGLFIYSYVHTLFGTFLPPCPQCPPTPPTPSLPGRGCSALFSNFDEEKTSNNKEDIEVLLVWDKDSYSERFLALLPCTCVLQPKLIHLCLTSSLLPSHLPILTSVSFKITILVHLQWTCQTLSSFEFPTFPIPPVCVLHLACDPCLIILLHLF
jgi:hypothetical protein